MPIQPPFIAPRRFTSASEALAQVHQIYDASIAHLRQSMQQFVSGAHSEGRIRAYYPMARIHTDTVARNKSASAARLSFGFVAGPGRFETTLTRPDLFHQYYLT